MQNHGIVVDHIGGLRVIALDDINHVRPAISQGRTKDRWVAPRVEQIAAWIVQRQAQAEHQTFFHFGDALLDLLRRQQVQPSELIVRAEIAPGGTLGSLFPACRCRHVFLLFWSTTYGLLLTTKAFTSIPP